MAKTSIKASDIFSDDEEEEDVEEEDQIDEPQPVEDLDIEEEDVDMDMDQETEEKEIEEEEPSVASLPSPLPGKARRKVLKKKTTKNSRGFLGKFSDAIHLLNLTFFINKNSDRRGLGMGNCR